MIRLGLHRNRKRNKQDEDADKSMNPWWIMGLLLFIFGLLLCCGTGADESRLTAQIQPLEILCQKFMGFGVEWDSRGYIQAGVTPDDFAIIQKRIEWMRLPWARIMMQAKWCYKGAGKYDYDSAEMQALYRHLDICQKLGITVFLTDWGCEPSWLKCPDVGKVDDPLYAAIIGNYMDFLLNRKKYSCIQYFIMVNEPNLEVKVWDRWRQGIENVYAEFKKRGLDKRVKLTGSDQSNGDEWHRNAVDQLSQQLGAYDLHRYSGLEEVRSLNLQKYFADSRQYALDHDPAAANKPFVVGEAGIFSKGFSASKNPLNMDYNYGVLMADYATQALNAGAWAVSAWMLDDNSHPDFDWGMWEGKARGLKLKPWFYTWALLSRYFPPGSKIVKTASVSPEVRIMAACCENPGFPEKSSWSICLVNRADKPATVRLQIPNGPTLNLFRYVYSQSSRKVDENGFPQPIEERVYDLKTGADIECEGNSVVMLTSIN